MGDVIFADIVDVGGRRFRKQSGSIGETLERVRSRKAAEGRRRAALPEEEEEDGPHFRHDDDDDGGSASQLRASTLREDGFTQHAGGMWTALVSADADLARHVTRHDPDAVAQLRRDHDASVALPGSSTKALPSGVEPPPPGSILVVAPSLQAARDAKRALDLALERALSSPQLQYTHFVCVPLCLGDDGDRLVATVRAFHRDVLSSAYAADCDIEPSIAHEPGHAHLTLCMLKLYSDEARARAIGAMDAMGVALKDAGVVGGGEPIELEVKGLDAMNSDFSAVDVLFLKVREVGPGRERGAMSAVCDAAVAAFTDAGLLSRMDANKPVKLHATVMNTRLRNRGGRNGGGDNSRRRTFDARRVMASHGDLDCGSVVVKTVHLSKRGEYDVDSGGFYRRVAEVRLCS